MIGELQAISEHGAAFNILDIGICLEKRNVPPPAVHVKFHKSKPSFRDKLIVQHKQEFMLKAHLLPSSKACILLKCSSNVFINIVTDSEVFKTKTPATCKLSGSKNPSLLPACNNSQQEMMPRTTHGQL